MILQREVGRRRDPQGLSNRRLESIRILRFSNATFDVGWAILESLARFKNSRFVTLASP